MLSIRGFSEEREIEQLSQYACLSRGSKGRKIKEKPCEVRTCFQRDRDRIIHSKSFRRLMHKTQVFLSPEGDHYRTRLTHTLEVAQVSRTIARALMLNEDLTEAIALGHDLGHTPFGHCGEEALNIVHPGGFKHNYQSLRVVDLLEKRKDKIGLNLTDEVRDGILNHSGENEPYTLEGKIVRLSDRIAYINHDIDDAIRAGVLSFDDIPKDLINFFGKTSSERINKMILNVIVNSKDQDNIIMSPSFYKKVIALRSFMFEQVYLNEVAKSEEGKAKKIITTLYDYYLNHLDILEVHYDGYNKESPVEQIIKDYIAGMSDRYIVQRYKEIFIPKFWR
jgi:dGTPase